MASSPMHTTNHDLATVYRSCAFTPIIVCAYHRVKRGDVRFGPQRSTHIKGLESRLCQCQCQYSTPVPDYKHAELYCSSPARLEISSGRCSSTVNCNERASIRFQIPVILDIALFYGPLSFRGVRYDQNSFRSSHLVAL